MFLYKHFVGGQEGTTELDDIIRNLNFVLKTRSAESAATSCRTSG